MTVCPKCNGRGTVGYFHIDHFADIECDRCHGSGEVEMTKLCNTCEYLKFCARSGIETVGCDRYKKDTTTNEEWLRSATTEQLANAILSFCQYPCEICKIQCDDGNACTYDKALNTIVEWLKQPHQ